MAITNDSKTAIRKDVELLEGRRNILTAKIAKLKDTHDRLVAERASVITRINNLKNDILTG